MTDYIGNIIDAIPEDIKGGSSTPASHHLFDIAEDTTKLSQTNAYLYHHFVEQLISLSNRDLQDIQLSVSFLCTIVRDSDTDDYTNLERMIKYIQGTIGLPMIISINKS